MPVSPANLPSIVLMAKSCPPCFKLFKKSIDPNEEDPDAKLERMLNCFACSGAFATTLITNYMENLAKNNYRKDVNNLYNTVHGFQPRRRAYGMSQKRKSRRRSRKRH